ncbi:hypothetical protein LTS18_010009 [Coniosporium uncinatum]|uniref:Uncharacterized protein n=1 Tax=Coniosporium uncinatum TaxID=93489 RepID=A0ACC3D0D8_9PEZI|nr:hypothetical protein LTS18_010009 [Coniosporium uncinatum]
MSESTECFTYLVSNAPQWIQTATDLRDKVKKRHVEFMKLSKKNTADMDALSQMYTGDYSKKKPPSASSSKRKASISASLAATSIEDDTPPKEPAKRGTWSILSEHLGSGPARFKSRNDIIIWYDSEIQKAFEQLVQNIGAGRNMLRKGKMAARVQIMSSDLGGDGTDLPDGLTSLGAFRSTRGLRNRSGLGGAAGIGTRENGAQVQAIEDADKVLEKAQALCEHAAHQFLRDGDCKKEVDQVKASFQEVIKVSKKEVTRKEAEEKNKPRPSTGNSALVEVDGETDGVTKMPPFRRTSQT